MTKYTAEKVTHINGDYFIKTFAPKTCSKYCTVFKYILQQNLKKNVKILFEIHLIFGILNVMKKSILKDCYFIFQ